MNAYTVSKMVFRKAFPTSKIITVYARAKGLNKRYTFFEHPIARSKNEIRPNKQTDSEAKVRLRCAVKN